MPRPIDVLRRKALIPAAEGWGFRREKNYLRLDGEDGAVAYLHLSPTPVPDRALTGFVIKGSITAREWTAWMRRGDGEDNPSPVGPDEANALMAVVPSFEFWMRHVHAVYFNFPYGVPLDTDSRRDGEWGLVTSDDALEACAAAVVAEVEAQDYVERLVRLLDRRHLLEVLDADDYGTVFEGALGLRLFVRAAEEPGRLDELLAERHYPEPLVTWLRQYLA